MKNNVCKKCPYSMICFGFDILAVLECIASVHQDVCVSYVLYWRPYDKLFRKELPGCPKYKTDEWRLTRRDDGRAHVRKSWSM